MRGKHSNLCPSPGDGKAATKIAKAEAKKVKAICKACGGADGLCDGAGDFSPSAIGAYPFCPKFTFPDVPSCEAPTITTLDDLIHCYDCIAEVEVDCVDHVRVPQFASYPYECVNPETCEDSEPFTCGGQCAPGLKCAAVASGPPYYEPVCGCIPDDNQPCEDTHPEYCNGTCGSGQCGSLGIHGLSACACGNPPCGEASFPVCAGDCPSGDECVAATVNGYDFCGCAEPGAVCSANPCVMGTCPNAGEICDAASCSCVPQ
jgi:hypothetical protein